LHQASHIDVALSDDTVEGSDDALIILLLMQHRDLRLLGGNVRLGYANCRLLRLEPEPVRIALLRGHPPFFDQRLVALPGHVRKIRIGLVLAQRRLRLAEVGLRLLDLMVELWSGDLGEKLALLDVVADVDIALVDIAAGAGEDVRFGKRGGGAG
jgi:hypothetical protein